MSKVKLKALTSTNSSLSVKSDNQKGSEDYKNYIYSQSIGKREFIDIKFVIF